MTTHRANPPAPAKRSARRLSPSLRRPSCARPATTQTSLRQRSGTEVHAPVS